MSDSRPVLSSGALHILGDETVRASADPTLYFRSGGGRKDDPVLADLWQEGVAITLNLDPTDQYAGTLPVGYGGKHYTLYYVADRIAEIQGASFIQVTWSLAERSAA